MGPGTSRANTITPIGRTKTEAFPQGRLGDASDQGGAEERAGDGGRGDHEHHWPVQGDREQMGDQSGGIDGPEPGSSAGPWPLGDPRVWWWPLAVKACAKRATPGEGVLFAHP
jgi:hypothetical protein